MRETGEKRRNGKKRMKEKMGLGDRRVEGQEGERLWLLKTKIPVTCMPNKK